jgi:hypothetical protein
MERGANISELLKKTAIPETLDSDTFEQWKDGAYDE